MKKIIIITPSYVDCKSGTLKIGGLETYIKDLSLLFTNNEYKTIIYQFEDVEKELSCIYNNAEIISLPVLKKQYQKTFDNIYAKHNSEDSIFILATDQMDIKSKAQNVIAIQHGIAFDIPGYMINGFWGKNKTLQFINKVLRCIKNVKRFYNTKRTVCVDYNYYNWFRTLGTIYKDNKISVIPNYSSSFISKEELEKKLASSSETKKIVFARRFVDYRGTLLFANIVDRILCNHKNVEITFAGNGPLENEIKARFSQNPRVEFTSFNNAESIEFHKNYDIAVVPTIFSEGTSLSLCEAMSAGCFGIATHVGGLTNILIDRHNGLLCSPDEDSLYESIHEALTLDKTTYNNIIKNGYNTVFYALSLSEWNKKWLKIITK